MIMVFKPTRERNPSAKSYGKTTSSSSKNSNKEVMNVSVVDKDGKVEQVVQSAVGGSSTQKEGAPGQTTGSYGSTQIYKSGRKTSVNQSRAESIQALQANNPVSFSRDIQTGQTYVTNYKGVPEAIPASQIPRSVNRDLNKQVTEAKKTNDRIAKATGKTTETQSSPTLSSSLFAKGSELRELTTKQKTYPPLTEAEFMEGNFFKKFFYGNNRERLERDLAEVNVRRKAMTERSTKKSDSYLQLGTTETLQPIVSELGSGAIFADVAGAVAYIAEKKSSNIQKPSDILNPIKSPLLNYELEKEIISKTPEVLTAMGTGLVVAGSRIKSEPTKAIPYYTGKIGGLAVADIFAFSPVVSRVGAKGLRGTPEPKPIGSVVTSNEFNLLRTQRVVTPQGIARVEFAEVQNIPTIGSVAVRQKTLVTKLPRDVEVLEAGSLKGGEVKMTQRLPTKIEERYYLRQPVVKDIIEVEGTKIQRTKVDNVLYITKEGVSKSIRVPIKEIKKIPRADSLKLSGTEELVMIEGYSPKIPSFSIVKGESGIKFGDDFADLFKTGKVESGSATAEQISKFKVVGAGKLPPPVKQVKFPFVGSGIPIPEITMLQPTKLINVVKARKAIPLKLEITTTKPLIPALSFLPITSLSFDTITKVAPKVAPKVDIATSVALLPATRTETLSALKTASSPALKTEVVPKLQEKLKIKIPITVKSTLKIPSLYKIKDKKSKMPKGHVEGYNTIMIERGAEVQANQKPLPKKEAVRLGRDVADNSLSASFKVTPADKTAPKARRSQLATGKKVSPDKFRKSKNPDRRNWLVEKRGSRLDTRGEIQGITASKLIAKRLKTLSKKKKK